MPTILQVCGSMVGTAQARLCPPYDSEALESLHNLGCRPGAGRDP
ncbi:hypothetical protein NK6_5618 [Bradyrhizobium diazoefficiens]|uniref:Uncharacterized protein n=1 Tax=Bradyrhizobium diazoefficiens TaxID=1355477 RepID=A0A0E4BSC7_9BRAD|nr:hypothetical protein NK6_5618 [Bradyrhizobium diazoefficiens]